MMMKIRYYIFLFVALLFAATGCEDLDTLPLGDIVTSEQKEEVAEDDHKKEEAGVNEIFEKFSTYMPNADALNAERHNDYGYPSVMMFTDHNGQDLVSDNNGYNWNGNNMSFSDRSYTSNEAQILWNDMYANINMANNVIDPIDRKSTRLNSSHVAISYAVFCLKKKKNKKIKSNRNMLQQR